MYRFIKVSAIPVGSVWTSCDGAGIKVTILRIDGDQVYYCDEQGKEYDKDAWSFQVRYFHPILSKA